MSMTMRKACKEDLPALTEIYNQSVLQRFQTADMTPKTVEDRKEWFEIHQDESYPLWVVEEESRVVGYLTLSPYRPGREALRFTAEISYYIHSDYQGRGIGSRLMTHGLDSAVSLGHKSLFAIIIDNNEGSSALLEKFGFEQWGHLPKIADYDGVEVGQIYYGRRIINN
jgi:L-amino acid N-acyltransferase YncA